MLRTLLPFIFVGVGSLAGGVSRMLRNYVGLFDIRTRICQYDVIMTIYFQLKFE